MKTQAESNGESSALRVAFLIESDLPASDIYAALHATAQMRQVDVVVYRLLTSRVDSFAEKLFDSLERARDLYLSFHASKGNSTARPEAPPELEFADSIARVSSGSLRLACETSCRLLEAEAVAQLAAQQFDLMLCCSKRILDFPAGVALLGAWGFEIGHGVSAFAKWAGAAELACGLPFYVARLVDYASPDRQEVYLSTESNQHASVRTNRLQALSRLGAAVRMRLESYSSAHHDHAGDHDHQLQRQVPSLLPLPDVYPSGAVPTFALFMRTCLRMAQNHLQHRLVRKRDFNLWHLAYTFSDADLPTIAFDQLRYLAPTSGTFWADPFPLIHDGRYYILFEELPYESQCGRLLAVEVFEHREATAPVQVLKRDYHLSYPHVFHWQDQLYMIPETKNAQRVELLRCVEFPAQWELCKVLLHDVQAVDATILRYDGTWWLFANIALDGQLAATDLHLYFADSLFGEWTPHPANPVCADVRSARPAGSLFQRDGDLFRPSQDGAQCYGHALWINQVEELSRQRYKERPVGRIEADWTPQVSRVHTVGQAGRLTVLDCVLNDQGNQRVQRNFRADPARAEN